MKPTTWSRVGPGREILCVREECPRVVLDVAAVGLAGVELRIVAMFEWPGRRPEVLILRRERIVGVEGALELAKAMGLHAWREEHEPVEASVLADMWALKVASPTELEAYRAKHARRKAETVERHKRLVDARRKR